MVRAPMRTVLRRREATRRRRRGYTHGATWFLSVDSSR